MTVKKEKRKNSHITIFPQIFPKKNDIKTFMLGKKYIGEKLGKYIVIKKKKNMQWLLEINKRIERQKEWWTDAKGLNEMDRAGLRWRERQ